MPTDMLSSAKLLAADVVGNSWGWGGVSGGWVEGGVEGEWGARRVRLWGGAERKGQRAQRGGEVRGERVRVLGVSKVWRGDKDAPQLEKEKNGRPTDVEHGESEATRRKKGRRRGRGGQTTPTRWP